MGIKNRAEELAMNFRMEGGHITQIEKYKYVGLMVTKDGKSETKDYLQQHEKKTIEHEFHHEITYEISEMFDLVSFDVRL